MSSSSINYDIAVIGGGASGMMAASIASKQGLRVLLIEKNKELGKKLSITGGARCNITNAEQDTKILLLNYGKASKFLHSAFAQFGMQDTIDYFESLGLPIKIESKKRAFPVSEKAQDVVDVLVKELSRNKVDVITGSEVKKISMADNSISGVVVDGKEYRADKYILATGGTSRPETGSTGDGFKWLLQMGHTIRQPTPNITPLAIKESWVKEVSGVKVDDVEVVFYSEGTRSFKVNGGILFTHFGISGPIILNSAYKVVELLEQGRVTAHIDLFPTENQKELDTRLIGILETHRSKLIKNVFEYILPPGLSNVVRGLLESEVNLDNNCSEFSKADRMKVIKLLKELPLTVEGLMGFEKAVVADGGVDLSEIDTRTMQSRIVSNLFITGDLLDINRPSGGYSLQLCWTTGYVAGS